jgi:predicted RNA-binding Zn-ribbon protein involved in translation (DUF1610 family)
MSQLGPFHWWPRFHDAAYRPSMREQFAMHWRANILMLRAPRAIVAFLLVSLWPVAVLLAIWWLLGFLGDHNPFVTQNTAGYLTAAATFAGFLLLQHIAFSQALVHSYAPFVRRAMCERGTPVCVACGTLLAPPRDASGGMTRCPECGQIAEPSSLAEQAP